MAKKLHIHSLLNSGYGWHRPKLPDFRHPTYLAYFDGPLPSSVDLRSQLPPVYDQGDLGSCFIGTTPILMADLTEREIQDVGEGNQVITHLGNKKMVTQVYKRKYTGNLITIKVKGNDYPLSMTEEHPVATVQEMLVQDMFGEELVWEKAKDLLVGNYVIIPNIKNEKTRTAKAGILTRYGFACLIESITVQRVDNIDVYNLEVEEDHTYVANFIVVHNCTANALTGMAEFLMVKQGMTPYVPSRLFIYWNERSIEGTVGADDGATLTDGATVISTVGCPHESLWWYNTSKFKVKPNKAVFTDAKQHLVGGVAKVSQNLDDMRKVLASGYCFVIGFTVYESFESDAVTKTGIVPMPTSKEQILGGHACLISGFSDSEKRFCFRNSWGLWGDKGYGYLPYDYLTNKDLSDDFWLGTSIS